MKEAEERLNSIHINGCEYEVSDDMVRHKRRCQDTRELYNEEPLEYLSNWYSYNEEPLPFSCTMEEFVKAEAELSRLKLRSFFLSAFLDPSLAKLNPSLSQDRLLISER